MGEALNKPISWPAAHIGGGAGQKWVDAVTREGRGRVASCFGRPRGAQHQVKTLPKERTDGGGDGVVPVGQP